jgi:hypothetical protein
VSAEGRAYSRKSRSDQTNFAELEASGEEEAKAVEIKKN